MMNNYDKLQIAERKVEILTEALRNMSLELLKAGETAPQLWHSDNEKQAFKQFTKMGSYGMDAIDKSMVK